MKKWMEKRSARYWMIVCGMVCCVGLLSVVTILGGKGESDPSTLVNISPTPTIVPTSEPTNIPIVQPSTVTTEEPEQTEVPEQTETPEGTVAPQPTINVTEESVITSIPTLAPTSLPTVKPTSKPTSKPTATVKPTTKPSEEVTSKPTVAPTKKPDTATGDHGYVPISKGWKATKSVKGEISDTHKKALDAMIKHWMNGEFTDAALKKAMEGYLQEQEIEYYEVAVTSEGYSLYEKIPEISLENGANPYSFMGIYSTGEQNPGGTNKTVCHIWTAYVF